MSAGDKKRCTRCGEVKPLDEFTRSTKAKTGRASRCRPCEVLAHQESRDRHPERRREYLRRYRAANRDRYRWYERDFLYGLSREDFERLLLAQSRECAVCRDPIDESAHVDHDHANGHVRGLLCRPCNQGIGFFRDNPEALEAAAAYLRRTLVGR